MVPHTSYSNGALATTIDFFAAQDNAIRRTRRLVPLVLVCAALVVIMVDLWVGLVVGMHIAHSIPPDARNAHGAGPFWFLLLIVPLEVYAATTVVVLAIIVAAILKRERELRRGSAAFAQGLGARAVDRDNLLEREQQLVNVAEEMALAAQLPPPALHVLDSERTINALAFASNRDDAAVILTRGAAEHLSRPELQALIGSALARVRNGDVELNVRLMGWLAGLTAVGQIGAWLMRMPVRVGRLTSSDRGNMSDLQKAAFFFSLVFVLIGLVIAVIGYAGVGFARWLRVLGARQRVLLADASALQFTRDPNAITALLQRLKKAGTQRRCGRYREEVGPLLFVPGVGWRCLPTHPSIARRIVAMQRQ
jgi:Zn-dependent protease with chaperone function